MLASMKTVEEAPVEVPSDSSVTEGIGWILHEGLSAIQIAFKKVPSPV